MKVYQQISRIISHELFKNSFIYTAANSTRNAIPFLLLPVLTRYLTPADYGIVATFEIILAITIALVGLNLRGSIWVNYFQFGKEDIKIYIGNTIIIQIVSFSINIVILYLIKQYMPGLIDIPQGWLIIIVIVALSQSIISLSLVLWQVEQKPFQYGLFQILQMSCNVGLSLYFIIVLGQNWQGRLLGITIAPIIFCLISIYTLYKRDYLYWRFNQFYIKDALKFCLPLIPHSLSGLIITGIDRFFINTMVSVSATGIYVIGYQVGMIIGLLARSFNQAWSVILFKKLKENNHSAKIKIVKFTYMYFVCIIALALFLSYFAPAFLSFFVGPEFRPAHKYVIWVALGYAADGMYYMVANYIFYVKKTHLIGLVTLSGAIINVIFNYVLIKANGPIGAAQATTISLFVCFVLTWLLSARVYKMPWLKAN